MFLAYLLYSASILTCNSHLEYSNNSNKSYEGGGDDDDDSKNNKTILIIIIILSYISLSPVNSRHSLKQLLLELTY